MEITKIETTETTDAAVEKMSNGLKSLENENKPSDILSSKEDEANTIKTEHSSEDTNMTEDKNTTSKPKNDEEAKSSDEGNKRQVLEKALDKATYSRDLLHHFKNNGKCQREIYRMKIQDEEEKTANQTTKKSKQISKSHWFIIKDPSASKLYYYNAVEAKTVWALPKDVLAKYETEIGEIKEQLCGENRAESEQNGSQEKKPDSKVPQADASKSSSSNEEPQTDESSNETPSALDKKSRQIGSLDWWEIDDPRSKHIYFFDAVSSKTTWNLPDDVDQIYQLMPPSKKPTLNKQIMKAAEKDGLNGRAETKAAETNFRRVESLHNKWQPISEEMDPKFLNNKMKAQGIKKPDGINYNKVSKQLGDSVWFEIFDMGCNRNYFYNCNTKKTQWTTPNIAMSNPPAKKLFPDYQKSKEHFQPRPSLCRSNFADLSALAAFSPRNEIDPSKLLEQQTKHAAAQKYLAAKRAASQSSSSKMASPYAPQLSPAINQIAQLNQLNQQMNLHDQIYNNKICNYALQKMRPEGSFEEKAKSPVPQLNFPHFFPGEQSPPGPRQLKESLKRANELGAKEYEKGIAKPSLHSKGMKEFKDYTDLKTLNDNMQHYRDYQKLAQSRLFSGHKASSHPMSPTIAATMQGFREKDMRDVYQQMQNMKLHNMKMNMKAGSMSPRMMAQLAQGEKRAQSQRSAALINDAMKKCSPDCPSNKQIVTLEQLASNFEGERGTLRNVVDRLMRDYCLMLQRPGFRGSRQSETLPSKLLLEKNIPQKDSAIMAELFDKIRLAERGDLLEALSTSDLRQVLRLKLLHGNTGCLKSLFRFLYTRGPKESEFSVAEEDEKRIHPTHYPRDRYNDLYADAPKGDIRFRRSLPYVCFVCGERFSRELQLDFHCEHRHQRIFSAPQRCPRCQGEFLSTEFFLAHSRSCNAPMAEKSGHRTQSETENGSSLELGLIKSEKRERETPFSSMKPVDKFRRLTEMTNLAMGLVERRGGGKCKTKEGKSSECSNAEVDELCGEKRNGGEKKRNGGLKESETSVSV